MEIAGRLIVAGLQKDPSGIVENGKEEEEGKEGH